MKRILIVDDQPINTQLLELQLTHGGYEVVACHDGLTALAELSRASFDAIVLDVMMPHPDGLETCRRMRAMEAGKRVPILFITSLSREQVAQDAVEAGGDGVLYKPVMTDEVLAAVADALYLHAPTPAPR